MKKFIVILASVSAFCAVAPAAQAATTISVEGALNSCDYVGGRCLMRQTYGDTNAVDVSYESIRSDGNVLGLAHNSISNYGNLGQVIVAGSFRDGTLGQMTLKARQGYQISLLDFDFVGYFNFAPTLPLSILDLSGNVLASGVFSTGTGSTHSNLAVNSAFLDGLVIRWGPDASVGGIDNIRYETRALAGAVPEPTTWAMMIGGFGLVGAAMRRSRRRQLAFNA